MAKGAGDEPSHDVDDANSRRKLVYACLVSLCLGIVMCALVSYGVPVREDPRFSVVVSGAHGLDPTSGSPVIRPAFNLTLRVENEGQDFPTCRAEVAATVYYAGSVVVGWAHVPDFCVAARSSAEMSVPLSHADVVLTDDLRRRLAVELRSGELELGVEMRMVFPRNIIPWDCHECYESSSRQSFQVCSVKPGQGYAPCRCLRLR